MEALATLRAVAPQVALQLRLFGDFEIRYRGTPLGGFDAPRLQSLLAFLLIHSDAPQSRKHLAFRLWPDSLEKQAHGNLRNLVHRLKHLLPEAETFLFADAQTLGWRAEASFSADVIEFQELLTNNQTPAATSAARPGMSAPDELAALSAAVALYRGELLPACYDDWILPERERLHQMFADALARLLELHESAGEFQKAIGCARVLLQADPLGEEAYRKLMRLYAQVGDRANVVRVYQTCVAVLKRELDAEPSARTRETFEQLRHDEPLVERPAAPRIKSKPNLPVPMTSFVGRAHELAEIRSLLGRARLVTLTGVGGGGKTRLAIQTAQDAATSFSDGVWFVDLAPLTLAADVPRTCAAVFGVGEQAGTSVNDLLVNYARDKELLVVLDNCEHLVVASAALAQTILHGAPQARILSTSREPLNLAGEALVVIPPLSLPDSGPATLESMAHSDAAQLFAARARFLLPTFHLNRENMAAVAQLCRRLDGIPLAIELAAARTRTLTPNQIASRLDDALGVLTRGSSGVPSRHQTMRAVLDWSDALLSQQDAALFRRLAVFAGDFTLDAAERVCVLNEPRPTAPYAPHPAAHDSEFSLFSVLDLLSNLIDKSLVSTIDVEQGNEVRYRLLEPIRQYAREKLVAAGEDQVVAAQHLDWYVELGEQMQAVLEGARQAEGIVLLQREYDNLRAALDFALRVNQLQEGLRLATALERFWLIGGHVSDGRARLDRMLEAETFQAQAEASTPRIHPGLHARAITVAGALAHRLNDFDAADALYQESLRIWQALDDQAGIALVLKQMGDAARLRGQYARAIEVMTQSLELWRALDHKKGIAHVLSALGATYSSMGDYARAGAQYREGLEIARELGDLWLIAMFINNLGVAMRGDDPDRAEQLFEETLAIRRGLGDRFGEAISLRNLAELALKRENWETARALFEASLRLNHSLENHKGVAECLIGLAWVELAHGGAVRAAQLLGRSERLLETTRTPIPEDDRAEYEDLVSRVRARMPERAFAAAWVEGRTLAVEQSNPSA